MSIGFYLFMDSNVCIGKALKLPTSRSLKTPQNAEHALGGRVVVIGIYFRVWKQVKIAKGLGVNRTTKKKKRCVSQIILAISQFMHALLTVHDWACED